MAQNIIGTTLANTFIGSSDQKIFDTKGRLWQGGKIAFSSAGALNSYLANYFETISVSTAMALTPSTLAAYGVSFIKPTSAIPTSGVGRAYLPAPIIGVEKTIVLASTAAGWLLDVDLTTDVGLGGSSGTFIGFSSLGTRYQAVTLIGLTTAMWGVKSVNSTVGGFDAATGIRQLTAVRTT